VSHLVVHLVLALHLLVEKGLDVLPAREDHGLVLRRRRLCGCGERLPRGPGGGALALAGLRVRRGVLLLAQHPWAHPSRGHGGLIGGWIDLGLKRRRSGGGIGFGIGDGDGMGNQREREI